jgi:hypothetical protein
MKGTLVYDFETKKMSCPMDVWMLYGPWLVSTFDIQFVQITDKQPINPITEPLMSKRLVGMEEGKQNLPCDLPKEIISLLQAPRSVQNNFSAFVGCQDKNSAYEALSRACLAWANKKGGVG